MGNHAIGSAFVAVALAMSERRRDGEPMFIILGRDPDGANIVQLWADRREAAGGDAEHVAMVRAIAAAMREYAADPANAPSSAPKLGAYPRLSSPPEAAMAPSDAMIEAGAGAFQRVHADTCYPTSMDGERKRAAVAIYCAMVAECPRAPVEANPAVAEVAERAAVVQWLREQSDKGAEIGIAKEKGSTGRAAFGGGSYALKVAADEIEAGVHLAARSPKQGGEA